MSDAAFLPIVFGDLTLDVGRARLVCAGRSEELPPKMFALLSVLFRNTDRLSRFAEIEAAMWPAHPPAKPRLALRQYVARTRTVIERLGSRCAIRTRLGYGLELIDRAFGRVEEKIHAAG